MSGSVYSISFLINKVSITLVFMFIYCKYISVFYFIFSFLYPIYVELLWNKTLRYAQQTVTSFL
jgi:hypothetical protein